MIDAEDIPTMEERDIEWIKSQPRDDYDGDYLASKRLNYEDEYLNNLWIFMEHSDGYTLQEIKKIGVEMGGGIYIEHRYTVITDPKWYINPIKWLKSKLP